MKKLKHTKISPTELNFHGLPWISEEMIKSLSRVTLFLSEEFGTELSQIGLYGSWQRGDAKPQSDVDIVVFLSHEVDWFDVEDGIVNRSDAEKDRFRWSTLEKEVNNRCLDSRVYSISVVTRNMIQYYLSKGPIHLQNWAYALIHSYSLWKNPDEAGRPLFSL